MSRRLLAKALGAIASYAESRDVPLVRVFFCDATAYDEGYMRPEDIAWRVRIKGRGGTVLQPAVTQLEQVKDFPRKDRFLSSPTGTVTGSPFSVNMSFSFPKAGICHYLKGKSSLMLYDQFGDLKFKYRNREFWCRG